MAYSKKVVKMFTVRLDKPLEDVYVERAGTFSSWWNEIVECAARLAAKRGLLG